MEKRENFYLFLDIDGVLWDWQWRLSQLKNGNFKNACSINNYNPESVQALNTLMDYLNRDYNCELVISSSRRRAMRATIDNLKNNSVHLPHHISRTSINNSTLNRKERILEYLQNKKDNKNFLIIDNRKISFPQDSSPKYLIQTNIYDHSLTLATIQNWIDKQENRYKKFDKSSNIL